MDMEYIVIELNHGGRFAKKKIKYYAGGKTNYFYEVHKEKFTYSELLGLVKDLGYDVGKCRIYYRHPCKSIETGLRLVYSDAVIPSLLEDSKETGSVIVYVEHDEHLGNLGFDPTQDEGPVANDETVGNEANVGGEVNVGADEDASEDDSIDENCEESDTESEEVNSIGDESDEEIIEVRRKLQSLKGKSLQTEPIQLAEPTDIPTEPNVPNSEPLEAPEHVVAEDGMLIDDDDVNSSNYDSPVGSDNEDNAGSSIRFPEFNPKTSMSKIEFEVGMKFCNAKELKEAITKYSISGGFLIKFLRNSKSKLLAQCEGVCPWRLWATYMQNESSFQIKSYNSEHNCGREPRLKLVTSKWLAQEFGDKIRNNPTWKVKEFIDEVLEKFNLHVTRIQCFRAKKRALGEVEYGLKAHYAKLRNYGREILRSNPNSTVKFKVDRNGVDDPPYFKRMYVCYDALKRGWLGGCRPVIGLDGCFLKSFCKGELLTAVGRDANNQMFPIAWAVVEVECKDSWSWFIELLIDDIGIENNGDGWTVITDQQKGLDVAILNLIPLAEHRCCARHIYSNFRKKHSGSQLKNLFWKASKSSTPEEYENVMKEINEIKSDAHDDLRKQNPKQWCRGFFSTHSKCDAVENNLSEAFNGTILEARCKPIIYMLEDIWVAVMVRMQDRREIMQNLRRDLDTDLCPKIREKLEENKNDQRFWTTTFNGESKFEVKKGQIRYVVDTNAKTCSCRMWDLSGIPCCHAVSAIYYLKHDPINYVHDWLKVGSWKAAYSYYMQPMNGEQMWPQDRCEPILPPPARRMPGRPQKNRRKQQSEEPKKTKNGSLQVTRVGRKMQCQICKEYGHNKKTCKKNPTQLTQKLPVKRKGTTSRPEQSTTTNVRKKKDSVPDGYGLFVSEETGNSFYRDPSQRRPVQLNKESQQITKSRSSSKNLTLGLKNVRYNK